MCVMGVQVTHCQDAHGCAKKQACCKKHGSVVWFGVDFWSTMHLSNVGSGACVIKYGQRWNVLIYDFLDVMRSIKAKIY